MMNVMLTQDGVGGTSGPVTSDSITDASTSGKAVLTGTPAQGRTAIGVNVAVFMHASGFTESKKTGSATQSITANRCRMLSGGTAGSTIAATSNYYQEPVSPIGSSESQRNLDSPTNISFTLCASATGAGVVFRAGFGKVAADELGDWTRRGYGVKLKNAALFGWWFDTSYHEVDLQYSLLIGTSIVVSIERSTAALAWKINGTTAVVSSVATLGAAYTNSSWRYELTNGAEITAAQIIASGLTESVVLGTGGIPTPATPFTLTDLVAIEVGGYHTATVEGARTYSYTRPITINDAARWYLVPNGDQSSAPVNEAIAGLKLFGSDFIADAANYDDFGIYNAPNGLVLNSKRLGTGAVKSFFFCNQDTDFFAKLDVVTGELELLKAGKGIVMQSPDGTRYRLTIANGGTVSVAAVV